MNHAKFLHRIIMPVKKREKRYMTPQEKRLRKMMLEHGVSQVELAEYFEISDPAIALRLKSLTPSSVQELENAILELSNAQSPKKVAS